ncbi:phosphopentomutase [Paracoccus kondratievae]|uniref:Phosphopentomutase n=1 Tax=Paracoccus kondratievae TaxID=135740 RepID=A0AAD3RV90_9RHOB|nr:MULTISPECIES: phosphopentomutase [Paracoccus]QFQ86437.1 phosphopentomutase [Paracoccus kondratievae]GLK65775.1 phosphopentomutase [Paracoccus kondratievae]SMG10479.1 phosphopentomutase [Paracoccus sp. J56]
MTDRRAVLIVMDSVGIGGAPDAAAYFNDGLPDTGANTLAHIAQTRPLHLPHLDALGLGAAIRLASGAEAPGLDAVPQGLWGAATEVSRGKDTPSGHWEIAGVPVPWDWHYFPDTHPSFPADLTANIARAAGTDGILGNEHASGTEIIARLGAEHLRTGRPICYTSADSVLQIAAHEEHFGLDRLYRLCEAVAAMVHPMRVGRVIARPFLGAEGSFTRTPNRRDYAIAPPAPTLLDLAHEAGRITHAIGKIGDIFSHRGISHLHKGRSDADLADHLLRLADEAAPGSLIFANFVEFDSLYGHRRDVEGYAEALEWFDGVAGALMARLRPGDLAIFTADHGNDPTWHGTDHTRERVPVLGWGYGARAIGQVGFADIAASVAAHLGLPPAGPGRSFL